MAIYTAFLEFAHILWEATKPTIFLTDNKSVTRFFQTKASLLSLWNAWDYVLQFNFEIAHIAGSVNTAAHFFPSLNLKLTQNNCLKLREDVQTTPIEVTTSSSEVTSEEQFLFTQTDIEDETEKQRLKWKKTFQEKCNKMVANMELSSMEPSITEFTKTDRNTTSYSLDRIKAKARIRVEQAVHPVFKNLKVRDLANHEVLLTMFRRIKHYKANDGRIFLEDGLFFRKNYGKGGNVKYYRISIPKQVVDEVLRSLHGEFGKQPGINNAIIVYREKNYYRTWHR